MDPIGSDMAKRSFDWCCFDHHYACERCENSSLARETWREICVSVADIFHMQISAHPRGAFISVGIVTPTEINRQKSIGF